MIRAFEVYDLKQKALCVLQLLLLPKATSTQIVPMGACETPGTMPWKALGRRPRVNFVEDDVHYGCRGSAQARFRGALVGLGGSHARFGFRRRMVGDWLLFLAVVTTTPRAP